MRKNVNSRTWRVTASLVAAAIAALVANASAEEATKGDPYPLSTCIVSGGKLGSMGEPIIYNHEGREVRFCCKGCVAKFKGDAAAYLKKIDKAITEQQIKRYLLDTCLVKGGKLGGKMGEAVNYVYGNRLVRFCCAMCKKDFIKAPAKYLAKLDEAAIAGQKDDYPLDACVVSGGKLGGAMGEPIDHVSANRLVRFCCKGCAKMFRKDPAKHLSKIDDALKTRKGEDKGQ